MTLFQNPFAALGKREWILYIASLCVVTAAAFFGETVSPLSLITSLIGVTALIFLAGGDVWGQILICIFAILYAIISLRLQYYGEAITYLGMSAPISFLSIISWIRHPYEKGKNVVAIHRLRLQELLLLLFLTVCASVGGYFLLAALDTPRLAVATFSIFTSFLASGLMFLRSPYYALAYAANDLVLILLWTLSSLDDLRYLTVVACFAAFLANDLYAYLCWRVRQRKQAR